MKRIITFICLAALYIASAYAQVPPFDTPDGEHELDRIEQSYTRPKQKQTRKTVQKYIKRPVAKGPAPKIELTWGADVGASIDMSGQDMSSIDFDLAVGMRRSWIKFLGIGVQADIMTSNSCRSYPLFALFRTNFLNRPTNFFWEVKAGASLNYLEHNHSQTGVYGFTGAGFRLASGAKFTSHIVIGYTFMQRRRVVGEEMVHNFKDLHCASVKIGVAF